MMDLVLVHQALHFGNIIIRFNKIWERGHDGSNVRNFFVFLHTNGSLQEKLPQLLSTWIGHLVHGRLLETSRRTGHEFFITLSAGPIATAYIFRQFESGV